jgi:hypothetical protein
VRFTYETTNALKIEGVACLVFRTLCICYISVLMANLMNGDRWCSHCTPSFSVSEHICIYMQNTSLDLSNISLRSKRMEGEVGLFQQ